ncbi:MAG: ATP-dependent DNA helicase RecG [Chloroflexota bacterium]
MIVPVEPLGSILRLEQKRHYDNGAVIGGLDGFISRWAADVSLRKVGPRFLARLKELQLTHPNYASWDAEKRRKWVERLLAWLEFAEDEAQRSVAVMPEAMPPSRPKPVVRRPVTTGGLDSPITSIKGVASGIGGKLARLGVKTVRDMLYFFPRRHIDYSNRRFIADLKEGEEQTIVAMVWQASVEFLGGRRGTVAVVGDETGNMRAVWFNQPYLAERLKINSRIAISGRITVYRGVKQFESPEWEFIGEADDDLLHTGCLVPVYPLTQGLFPKQVRRLARTVVDGWADRLVDFMSEAIQKGCRLEGLSWAVRQAHFPDSQEALGGARRRLAFDELFLFQMGVLGRKREWQESQPGSPLSVDRGLVDRLVASLPFALTRAQIKALEEILADIQKPKAMSRLLQGEVGSGKTVVAVVALVVAVDNGYQGAFMAPTEILAEQHFNSVCQFLKMLGGREEDDGEGVLRYHGVLDRPVVIARLVGALSARAKKALHQRVESGEIGIIIGTHAIIQKDVAFKKLGLAVVDEQHRFGVEQRSALRQKGFNPHVLAMTATPIPRTMALTLYGDLDLSVIDELPPGRLAVKTRWVYPEERPKAYDFVRRQAAEGRQTFIICPLIEESEAVEAKAAVAEYERLSGEIFPQLRLGLLHGRMSAEDKEGVMAQFRAGELDILVSTAVVEVGIDVPNATVMLVEGADRFGLSQLHQFRGRVGRGQHASYCLLLAENPSKEGRERLRLIERVYNGFVLAEEDLKMRGPGEFFGTRQSGLADFRMAKLSDVALLELARTEAMALWKDVRVLKTAEYRPLMAELARTWPGVAEWS